VSLTTAQLEAGALTVPCPEHQVAEGTECPRTTSTEEERDGAVCLTRQSLASARRELAEFPRGDELDGLNWRELMLLACRMRDAAQDASNCVDLALAPFGI
jgi:hypothetical protein